MNKSFLFFIILCSYLNIYAQRTADVSLSFDNQIQDLIIVPFNGIAVITEGNNIHGYDPIEEQLLWTNEIIKKNASDVAGDIIANVIPESAPDFIIIEDTPFVQKMFNDKLYIYNSINGNLVFEPKDQEKYFEASYLFDENALLLRGVKEKELILAKYSMSKKQFEWKTAVSSTYGKFIQDATRISGSDQSWSKDKFDYTADKVFALIKSHLYVLDKSSGALLWKKEDEKISDFLRSHDGEKLITVETTGFLVSKSKIDLFNSSSGKKIWDRPIETKYLVLFEDWEDKMLLAHYKGFNFYDYDSGDKLWEKDPKGKGIKSVIPLEKDFLYVYDDEMMLLDKNGKKLWKKDVKICDDKEDPIFFLEKTNNSRVLYVTSSYANLVNYKNGEKIWKKNLKLNDKRPVMAKYDHKSGDFIVYNDEKLYRFNQESNERPEPFAKLKLKNEKMITNMELFQNVISISGENEVIGVDRQGNVVFHNTYIQPGELGRRLLKSTAIAGQIVGGLASTEITVTTTYRDADGNTVENSQTSALFGEKAKAIGEAGYYAGRIGQQFVQDRFLAMQETDSYSLIFSKGKNGEKLLIKVDKETGKELDKIVMENNKPIYDVDYVSDDLYYTKGSNLMVYKNK